MKHKYSIGQFLYSIDEDSLCDEIVKIIKQYEIEKLKSDYFVENTISGHRYFKYDVPEDENIKILEEIENYQIGYLVEYPSGERDTLYENQLSNGIIPSLINLWHKYVKRG